MRMRVTIAVPEGELQLAASRLEPLPALGAREWAERRVRDDAPTGCDVVVTATREVESAHGWPLLLIACEVRARATGAVVEHRRVGCYRCIHHGGTVELRARRPIGVAELAPLLAAVPDFGSEVACLADVLGDP
jgi:hypothetical protein